MPSYVSKLASPFRAVLCLVLFAAATEGRAGTVSLQALKDNTLYESATGDLSNGAGGGFFAGASGAGTFRRGLVAFDVASAIPAGATITGVTLTLDMSQTSSGPQDVALHRASADWGEGTSVAGGNGGAGAPSTPGDATWIHTFFPTDTWAAAGGDFEPMASAVESVDGLGVYSWSGPGMVTDVQAWLDDPSTNFGWVLVGNEDSGPQTAKRFSSRETPDPALRPVLVVEFEPGATPTPATGVLGALVLALALGGMTAYLMRTRASQR